MDLCLDHRKIWIISLDDRTRRTKPRRDLISNNKPVIRLYRAVRFRNDISGIAPHSTML